jgi:hypothetical protein
MKRMLKIIHDGLVGMGIIVLTIGAVILGLEKGEQKNAKRKKIKNIDDALTIGRHLSDKYSRR